jgi:hypothetical protein
MSPFWGKVQGRGRRGATRWTAVASAAAVIVLSAVATPSSASAAPAGWPDDVFAVGTFDGIAGNASTTADPTVATIQAAVTQAQTWAGAHQCHGAPCDTYVLLAPGDYKTVPAQIDPAPPGQSPAGVLIKTANVWLVGMNRDGVIIDGTRRGPPCSDNAGDQVFGPSTSPEEGLNGVMVWKAAGNWVENLTVCNFLDGRSADGNTGNEIWWNGGANGGVVFDDTLGGFQGNYLTATSTYYPQEDPATGVSTDLAGESTAATYGIFSSDWDGGSWNQSYASNFNDSGYYIGACQDRCNQTVNQAWAEYNALGYSGSNSGGTMLIEHSKFDNNEDGFDTNSQNGDNPPPQNGACPPGVSPPLRGAHTCWVFYDNLLTDNNNPDVPTYGSAAAGPVGTGMSLSGARNDTVLDNTFTDNGAWGNILVPYPDSGPPCTGGTLVAPSNPSTPASGQLCLFDDYGDAVVGNSYSHNGFFGNPTNGDVGAANLEPGPSDCFSANTDAGGLTTAPPEAEVIYPTCTGTTVPPDLDPAFVDQVACDSGTISIFGPFTGTTTCPPGAEYPRQTMIVMHPLPGAVAGTYEGRTVPALENPASATLATMPSPCASLIAGGMAANPWCPAARGPLSLTGTPPSRAISSGPDRSGSSSGSGSLPSTGGPLVGLVALSLLSMVSGTGLVLAGRARPVRVPRS